MQPGMMMSLYILTNLELGLSLLCVPTFCSQVVHKSYILAQFLSGSSLILPLGMLLPHSSQ